ncbi:Integral membrane protein of the Golgi [Microsporum ferrugineum]
MRRRRLPRAGALADLPPSKIIRKILAIQLAYYVCATVLILFTALVAGTAFSPDLILSWRTVRGDTTVGWTLGFVWLLNSSLGAIFLLLFVSRSKLIPDFAFTLHFIHLTITSFYTHSVPTNMLWWGLQTASATLMTFLGIWACQWRELRPIAFGGQPNSSARQPQSQATDADIESGIDLENMSRGRGRGRGRDGGGDYAEIDSKEVKSAE